MEPRRWTTEQVKQEITKNIIVTRQEIALATAFLLNLKRTDEYESNALIARFATERGHTKPGQVLIHPSVDIDSVIAQVAAYIVATIACAEAIWLLIHDGVLLYRNSVTDTDMHIGWTTVVSGGSGQTGGWSLDDFRIQVPIKLSFTPSHRQTANEALTNPSLLVLLSKIHGADTEVVDAVQDSITCFRRNLFRATVVLLGKAMEGAWIELGVALANSVPGGTSFNKTKFLEQMADDSSTIKKANEILRLYKNKEYIGNVMDKFGIPVSEIENILVWSEVLRDARNAIHFGVRPTIPNTYEKAAVLLLAGADHLSKMYQIKRSAEA